MSVEPKDWREAFFALEDQISRMVRAAEVARYLADEMGEEAENGNFDSTLIQMTNKAVTTTFSTVDDVETAYYEAFNALVGRDWAARAAAE